LEYEQIFPDNVTKLHTVHDQSKASCLPKVCARQANRLRFGQAMRLCWLSISFTAERSIFFDELVYIDENIGIL
jgi:hypothetical protein